MLSSILASTARAQASRRLCLVASRRCAASKAAAPTGGTALERLQALRAHLSFANVKEQVKRNGPAAVAVYAAAWVVPFGAAWTGCVSTGNFGVVDPLALLPESVKTPLLNLFGMQPADTLPPWQVSLAMAYLFTDVLEPGRIAVTLWGAPLLTAWWASRHLRGGAAHTAPRAAAGGTGGKAHAGAMAATEEGLARLARK